MVTSSFIRAAEKDIGRWKFELEAMDNEGDLVKDLIEIIVRQDSKSRVINHEFSIQLKLRKKLVHSSFFRFIPCFHSLTCPLYSTSHACSRFAARYDNEVDWKIAIVEKLSDIFGDVDARDVVVLSVSVSPGGPTEGLTFTWRNNSLPTHSCPEDKIVGLLNMLTQNKEGDLKRAVSDMLLPEFEGKRAWVEFKGSCRASSPPVELPTVEPPVSGPEKHNTRPVVHHHIDQIVAQFGKLLRYTVPEVMRCYLFIC